MGRPRAKRINSPLPAHSRTIRRVLHHELDWLRPRIEAAAASCAAERYRKHFDSVAHAGMLLFHGLNRGQSLRQSYAVIEAAPSVQDALGLTTAAGHLTVSYSQFAASNTSRPANFLADVLPAFIARVRHIATSNRAIPPDLHLLDATFLRVSLTLAGWLPSATNPRNKGVRIQTMYHPATDLPEQVRITTTSINDVQSFDAMVLECPERLAELAGQTLAFDLGYYSHRRFVALLTAGIHFITRLHPQATVMVTADRPIQLALAPDDLPTGRITVLHDQCITLGSATNRAGAVLSGIRLVTGIVQPTAPAARQGAAPVTYQILTDRFDLAADDVVQCYLWRWEIELFFRWLKSHLKLPRLLGYSENAIMLTVVVAVFVHLLCLLLVHACGQVRRSPKLLVIISVALLTMTAATAHSPPAAVQMPLPGWSSSRATIP